MSVKFCKLQLATGRGDYFAANPELVRAVLPNIQNDKSGRSSMLVYGSDHESFEVVGTVEQIVRILTRADDEIRADWR